MIGLATGALAAFRLWPERFGPAILCLAVGTGLGGVSLISYAWLIAGKPGLLVLAIFELMTLALVAGLGRHQPRAAAVAIPGRPPLHWLALLGLAILSAGIAIFHTFAEFPDGAWDAVEIWNMRARSLLRGDLSDAFTEVRHADYPLLLPLLNAHFWHYAGPTRLVPMAVSASFTVATAGLLYSATSRMRGHSAGAVLTIALLATPFFAFHGASQRADVPLAYFMLAAAFTLVCYETRRNPRLLVLAGVQLGCALWTKNEGILFAIALTLAWIASRRGRELRGVVLLALGALPFAAALLHHKLTCGGVTDLIQGQGSATGQRLADGSRYLEIAGAFASEAAPYALIAVVLGFALFRGPGVAGARFVALSLAAMLVGYFGVYLVTPHDLTWHLDSSLDRLFLQLWPTLLFTLAVGGQRRTRGAESSRSAR